MTKHPTAVECNYDEGYEETFRRLGKYESTERDAAWLIAFLGLQPGSSVLDVPCGFGRHSQTFYNNRMRVTGIDASPAQIAAARTRYPGINFIRGGMSDPLRCCAYDLVINLWTSFGYLANVEADQRLLDSWFSALTDGGRLVMELSTVENARHESNAGSEDVTYKSSVCNGVEEKAAFYWSSSLAVVTYSRPGWSRTFHTRMYARSELCEMLVRAGFGDVQQFGGFQLRPPTSDSRTVLIATREV